MFTISYSASVITVKKCQETQNPNQFSHNSETTFTSTFAFVYLMTQCQKIDWRDSTYGMGAMRASNYQYSIISFLIIPARNDPCGDDTVWPNYRHLPCINHRLTSQYSFLYVTFYEWAYNFVAKFWYKTVFPIIYIFSTWAMNL